MHSPSLRRLAVSLLLSLILMPSGRAQLRVSSRNPRYFVLASDTNTAVFLAGSHTWLNNVDGGWANLGAIPPFNWNGYLTFLSTTGHTLIKYWAWESAWQSLLTNATNYRPSNIQPFKRTGPGLAEDGGLKWNLDSLDQAYFDRVKGRIDELASHGVYAQVMLFNGWSVDNNKGTGYTGNPFKGHPFNIANNVNGVGFSDTDGANTQRLAAGGGSAVILAYQVKYVKKMIDELNPRDNVLWEICNEANSESQDWQYAIIDTIRNYESRKPKQHPISMSTEFPGANNAELYAAAAHNNAVSPAQDYSTGVAGIGKVILTDSDHICGECMDGVWVYKSFMNGVGGILYMDPWDGRNYPHMANPYDSAGASWVSARIAMGHVVRMAKKVNLIDMSPSPQLASTGYCLQGGNKWIVYQPSDGQFTVDLSSATDSMAVDWLDLRTGSFVSGLRVRGGGSATTLNPPFSGSALVYVHPSGFVSVRWSAPPGAPESLVLSQNYPNPFNPSTTIDFDVPRDGIVKLLIYDASGKIVRTLANGAQPAGRYSAVWDGRDDAGTPVASGLYICRLVAGNHILSRKMLLIR